MSDNGSTTVKPLLLQCPFCGSQTARKVGDNQALGYAEHFELFAYAVVCSAAVGGCGSSSGFWGSPDEAIEQWNQRAEE